MNRSKNQRPLRSSRAPHAALFESLEPRALLSSSHLVAGGLDDHGNHNGTSIHSANSATPITDLTGVPGSLTGIAGVKFQGDVATLTSVSTPTNFKKYAVSIDWGDGARITHGKIRLASDGTIHLTGEHRYLAPGDFALTITVTQKGAASPLVITSAASIAANTPSGLTITPTAGTEFSGPVGNFTIPVSDTTTDPTTFTALIKWGDHTRATQGTITLNPDGSYTVAGTHTYSAPGTYRITILAYQKNQPLAPAAAASHTGESETENENEHGTETENEVETHHNCAGRGLQFAATILSTATVSAAAPTTV